jgi:UDPglucose 6-dehydrogenase
MSTLRPGRLGFHLDQLPTKPLMKALAEKPCAEEAKAVALVTEWHEYRRPNFARLAQTMRGKVVFDGRNIWEPADVRAAGLTYYGIGRGRG